MSKTHDYKAYDAAARFNHRAQLAAVAKTAGFKFISQAIVELYRQKKSMRKTAAALNLTRKTVAYHLKRIGEPINAAGGYRNGDRRLGTVRKY